MLKICKADLLWLLLFLSRFPRRRKMRVGRLSGGAVGWVARHGCRASAVGPWMARRRVPTPRCRSEGTAAKRGPYASAMVLVTFAKTKVTRPSGRNLTQQRKNAVGADRFQAQLVDPANATSDRRGIPTYSAITCMPPAHAYLPNERFAASRAPSILGLTRAPDPDDVSPNASLPKLARGIIPASSACRSST